ncbi:MAG: hypothetical protein ACYDEV_13815 [Acidiferrobacter sp.]
MRTTLVMLAVWLLGVGACQADVVVSPHHAGVHHEHCIAYAHAVRQHAVAHERVVQHVVSGVRFLLPVPSIVSVVSERASIGLVVAVRSYPPYQPHAPPSFI